MARNFQLEEEEEDFYPIEGASERACALGNCYCFGRKIFRRAN